MNLINRVLFLALLLCTFSPVRNNECSSESGEGELIHAAIIFRHGNRSALATWPTDEYKDFPWASGMGQLTNAGKRRLYENGKWFRKRYCNLVSESYKPGEIKVQTSDIDRTIMSGECFLRGFYPSTNEQNTWMKGEKWQPIPIRTIPGHLDNLINSYGSKCRRRSEIVEHEHNSEHWNYIRRKYKDVIEFLEKKTGRTYQNESNKFVFGDLVFILDTMRVFGEHNLRLPEWASQVYPEPLATIANQTLLAYNFSLEKSRLDTGPLLGSIVEDMRSKINEENFTQNLRIYSGHDTTLNRLKCALGMEVYLFPEYGTTMMFELRYNGNNHIVNVLYRNTTYEPPYRVNVRGCGTSCTFEQFENALSSLIPLDWDMECGNEIAHQSFYDPFAHHSEYDLL